MPGRARVRKAVGILVGVSLATVALGYAAQLNVTADSLTTFTSDDGPTPTVSPSGSATPSPTPVSATCTLAATKDTYVDESTSGNSDTTNFGTAAELVVRSRGGISQKDKRAVIQFDLTACSPAIPSDATIDDADVELFMSAGPTEARTHDIYRLKIAWIESGIGSVTWNNQPWRDLTNAALLNPTLVQLTDSSPTGTTNGVTINWDVATDVDFYLDNPTMNFGWLIKDQTEGVGDNQARQATFTSRTGATVAQRPKLVIDYTYTP